ncbi:hypothetical protein [Simiduia agarivorans]|uniref:Uncharacterized protein n=1 Tax=Simiduia agarivorans (strain DSM 21679 / JCM 13881 / BCRC 17597 / SA1) TaxID=1117647 RepID=K4KP65_SIMAS|nr:hypothetical protein [Simiduia agarivorans]AFV00031.1 hypothetical protein M5M_14470 [Simiduia agarivorans SA1 = DSM 21679]
MFKGYLMLIALLISSIPGIAESQTNAEAKPSVGEAMNRCLASFNWSSWNMWRFDVYASAQDKVLIGDIGNYYRFTSAGHGFEHVIDGKIVEQNPAITRISELTYTCTDNCPNNIQKRINWFKRRCKAFES